jgi:hypothetical protein
MIRTNLEADSLSVVVAATPGACLAVLHSVYVSALVLDADLVRDDGADGSLLLRYLLGRRVPTLLISWDPGDRLLARTLHNAPFISRPDNIDAVRDLVQQLLGAPVHG